MTIQNKKASLYPISYKVTDEQIKEAEQNNKEESFKTKFVKDLEQEDKEAKQILNNYYGED